MRGRPGCPTGQEKKPVGATGSNPLFYKERLGTESPPHPPQCAHWGTFPPRGRLWTWECLFPSEKPPPPARPAGGRAVTNVGLWAAGQSRNIEKTSPWPPTRERWVQGGRTSSSLALFPPAFSGESRAPARSRAGTHVAGPTLRRSRRHHLPTAARQSRSRLPPNQKGRPQGLPFSPIPCYALVTVFRMPLPAVSLGLVSKPSFS